MALCLVSIIVFYGTVINIVLINTIDFNSVPHLLSFDCIVFNFLFYQIFYNILPLEIKMK